MNKTEVTEYETEVRLLFDSYQFKLVFVLIQDSGHQF